MQWKNAAGHDRSALPLTRLRLASRRNNLSRITLVATPVPGGSRERARSVALRMPIC